MRETEARFGKPVQVGEVTITPLVEVTRWAREDTPSAAGGSLKPLGILVEGPGQTLALDLEGRALPYLEGA